MKAEVLWAADKLSKLLRDMDEVHANLTAKEDCGGMDVVVLYWRATTRSVYQALLRGVTAGQRTGPAPSSSGASSSSNGTAP